MNSPLLLVIITSLLLVYVPRASAEVSDWVVVPASDGEMPPFMERVVAGISRELERHGRHVWPSGTVVTRFEQRSSTGAAEVTDIELEKWARHSRAAIRHLARGNHAMALDHLERAEQLSRRATEELNQDKLRAQRVLDTCLYAVRALLETHDVAGAKAHAGECVLLVPRGEPATIMHPPLVLNLYEQARDAGREKSGSLIVESDPSGCDVRINGVRFGQTPLETNELAIGEYAVEVECDGTRRGRIHSAEIGSGTTRLFIDTRFDHAVRTEPILRLEYSKQRGSDWRVTDARAVAEVLAARMVVLVSALTANTIELDLVSRTGSRQGCARIVVTGRGPSTEALGLAVRKLVEGKCSDPSALGPIPPTLFMAGG
ncbi:MAG: PEGA domain-containing protein [Deltaproteobacteria bacterium]|nr:PEGA domain-containing protein [Deltaproteobacteria bacterium]MBW2161661.1 PEGA domain-containing protein [Deltaproteobacteria bacterium]MBW2214179.1 PEGA domain-containing protein [Deltaproteobacteria bacterium]MBW2380760.1 PEGA domain-containing protein [Deltaproteobacteria bacterium]MBW2586700.1 PEGA domain-containing protein [Deltaproteobacteria bacterium]